MEEPDAKSYEEWLERFFAEHPEARITEEDRYPDNAPFATSWLKGVDWESMTQEELYELAKKNLSLPGQPWGEPGDTHAND